jgi:hypothetical protein
MVERGRGFLGTADTQTPHFADSGGGAFKAFVLGPWRLADA